MLKLISRTPTIRNRAEQMTDEPIRPSEDPLLVFISSRQDEELSLPRGLAIKEVESYPGMRAWAFEDAPASSEAARARYVRNAGRADMVIWLIGSKTTTPIVEEIGACMRAQGRLLAFMLPATERDDETEALTRRVSNYATWKTIENVDDLPDHIRASLTDEILRRYRDPAPVNHDLYLRQKHRESIADTKRLWATLGVPENNRRRTCRGPLSWAQTDNPHYRNTDGKCTARIREDAGSTSAIPVGAAKPAAGPFPTPACISERTQHQRGPEGPY